MNVEKVSVFALLYTSKTIEPNKIIKMRSIDMLACITSHYIAWNTLF